IQVVGCVRRNNDLVIDERHLGLIPSNEKSESQQIINRIASIIEQQVDLEQFVAIGASIESDAIGSVASEKQSVAQAKKAEHIDPVKVGVFQDASFGFYYADDLETLQFCGAELVAIDALQDLSLPEVDALFIGGGFPETHMQALSANERLMGEVRNFIENHGVVYAECGGLMYLSESLTWKDKECRMCGVLPGKTVMHEKPQGRGYIRLAETGKMPWPGAQSEELAAHEFHYSSLEGMPENCDYAFRVVRGHGIDGYNDGYVYKNLLANYAHMRNVGNNHWAERFIAHIVKNRK
ncbi:MAG: cobyrinic acid a,c-diamide synthase, partial [Gammaproteobacteria bacterium]|nr:cobyrinic acid a,c-diamide synthase [Gammaproteobacteria bacterium]